MLKETKHIASPGYLRVISCEDVGSGEPGQTYVFDDEGNPLGGFQSITIRLDVHVTQPRVFVELLDQSTMETHNPTTSGWLAERAKIEAAVRAGKIEFASPFIGSEPIFHHFKFLQDRLAVKAVSTQAVIDA